jgi:hypothetical protein
MFTASGASAQTTLERVKIRQPANSGLEAVAARLRLERQLDEVDWHPPGLPPHAVLVVRSLSVRWRHLHGRGPGGSGEISRRIEELYRQAWRPGRGPVPPYAESVIFEDMGEMLACLALDYLRDQVGPRWYWQQTLGGNLVKGAGAVAALWSENARFIPGALAYLTATEAATLAGRFDPLQVQLLTERIQTEFGLPNLVIEPEIFYPLVASDSFQPIAIQTFSKASQIPIPPWQPWLAADIAEQLPVMTQFFLGLGLTLRQRPAFARSAQFRRQTEEWLQTHRNPNSGLATWSTPSNAPLLEKTADSPGALRATATAQTQAFPKTTASQPEHSPELAQSLSILPSAKESRQDIPRQIEPASLSSNPVEDTPELVRESVDSYSHPEDEPTLTAFSTDCQTELAGLFYLVNLLSWLELPSSWSLPGGDDLSSYVSGWEVCEILGRGLLGAHFTRYKDDPVWKILAQLDGRNVEALPAQNWLPQADFCLPPAWLGRYTRSEMIWRACKTGRRLRIVHAQEGWLVAAVALNGQRPEALAEELLESYRQQGVQVSLRWDGPYRVTRRRAGRFFRGRENWQWSFLGRRQHIYTGLNELNPGVKRWAKQVLGFIAGLLGQRLKSKYWLKEMLCHQGYVTLTNTHLDIFMKLDEINLSLRRTGLDCDPGWMPDLGYIVLFHFE